SSLKGQTGIAFDSSGNLWVSDTSNNRVLKYTAPFTTNGKAASLVIGQSLFTTKAAPNPPTASSLSGQTGIAFDSSGTLWVSDTSNNRALKYNTPFTTGEAASLVIGQSGFTSKSAASPPTASSLNTPTGIA